MEIADELGHRFGSYFREADYSTRSAPTPATAENAVISLSRRVYPGVATGVSMGAAQYSEASRFHFL
jgi:hypothetical protein